MWEPRHENVSGFVVQYDEQAYLTCSTYNDFQRFSISTLLQVKDFFFCLAQHAFVSLQSPAASERCEGFK